MIIVATHTLGYLQEGLSVLTEHLHSLNLYLEIMTTCDRTRVLLLNPKQIYI